MNLRGWSSLRTASEGFTLVAEGVVVLARLGEGCDRGAKLVFYLTIPFVPFRPWFVLSFFISESRTGASCKRGTERLAKEEQERLAREEQERIAREEQQRLAREEQERLAREEQERLATNELRIREGGKVKFTWQTIEEVEDALALETLKKKNNALNKRLLSDESRSGANYRADSEETDVRR